MLGTLIYRVLSVNSVLPSVSCRRRLHLRPQSVRDSPSVWYRTHLHSISPSSLRLHRVVSRVPQLAHTDSVCTTGCNWSLISELWKHPSRLVTPHLSLIGLYIVNDLWSLISELTDLRFRLNPETGSPRFNKDTSDVVESCVTGWNKYFLIAEICKTVQAWWRNRLFFPYHLIDEGCERVQWMKKRILHSDRRKCLLSTRY